ncbi:hypothetical protein [Lutibacter sp. Hel_I_33_5]|uniref:hypothetical protein n=1 Tax=Lutibacter sp. Hel_I_33_5 TaxID=1566289 RepID=UPI001C95F31F|nr:hypothetical protein [Lutibacter sp. Hel_I_33_5]
MSIFGTDLNLQLLLKSLPALSLLIFYFVVKESNKDLRIIVSLLLLVTINVGLSIVNEFLIRVFLGTIVNLIVLWIILGHIKNDNRKLIIPIATLSLVIFFLVFSFIFDEHKMNLEFVAIGIHGFVLILLLAVSYTNYIKDISMLNFLIFLGVGFRLFSDGITGIVFTDDTATVYLAIAALFFQVSRFLVFYGLIKKDINE